MTDYIDTIKTIRSDLTGLHGIVGDFSKSLTALDAIEQAMREPEWIDGVPHWTPALIAKVKQLAAEIDAPPAQQAQPSDTERAYLIGFADGKQAQAEAVPVDMVLYCPKCGTQHIDAPEDCPDSPGHCECRGPHWKNPPHKSHLCHGCGHIWRPSDTPTNGVKSTSSGKDADTAPQQAEAVPQDVERDAKAYHWLATALTSPEPYSVLETAFGHMKQDQKPTKAEFDAAVYAAIAAAPQPKEQSNAVCRSDGKCQYAIDHDAEKLGHCPTGKCVMPRQAETALQPKGGV